MKIILLKKVENIGVEGDIINVKNGFAKNYLLPQSKAVLATPYNINNFIKFKNETTNIEKLLQNDFHINDTTIIIPVKTKLNNEIYGVINTYKLGNIIKKLNLKLSMKNLNSNVFLKNIGNYKIEFKNKNTLINIYIMLIKIND